MTIRLIAAATALVLATPAIAADRPATEAEATNIARVLNASGFVTWDDIDWDEDGYWEVDDAERADGTQWDLRLAAETFEILRSRRDD